MSEKYLKLRGKNPKLKEKTQNSRQKLKVWEALTSYVYPGGVKKNACFNQKPSDYRASNANSEKIPKI